MKGETHTLLRKRISSVQSFSHVQLCDPMNRSTPGLSVHHQLLEFAQTYVHRVGDAIQPSHPLSPLFLLPPIPPSIRAFSSESNLHVRWPKYWSFSFSISPSNEYPGLISFRMDWLNLLSVQGTLKSLLQHHSAMKRDETGSAIETWMDLGSVIQSEVSQKEKNKYCILTHTCGI